MQDIKTAPKDGTWVVVANCGEYIEAKYDCTGDSFAYFWRDRQGNKLSNPTHWINIPVVKKPMTRDELLAELTELSTSENDLIDIHIKAYDLLLEFINDDEITALFH
jgi:hypothetical protein